MRTSLETEVPLLLRLEVIDRHEYPAPLRQVPRDGVLRGHVGGGDVALEAVRAAMEPVAVHAVQNLDNSPFCFS